MRLRNKKTGEIMDDAQYRNFSLHDGFGFRNGDKEYYYHSLAELNDEWEDAPEEPKKYWCINWGCTGVCENKYSGDIMDEFNKSIGNYFSSKEEAKKVVEKLKAWRRLKDKGFKFNKWTIPEEPKTPHIKLVIEAEMDVPDSPYDLGLLFGGEE